ncbi:MAG: cupredoxin domain-containing protein [bacterium]|nr:cupredoxin domain-containing protein [bacterium]
MKKIIIALIVVVIAGVGIYYSSSDRQEETTKETHESSSSTPSPTPVAPTSPVANPTPPPATTNPPAPPPTTPPPTSNPPAPTPTPAPNPTPPAAPQTRIFNITGTNYAFSQKEIKVKQGEIVVINFESTNGFHDLTIANYGVGTKSVMPGTKTSVEFTADKAGTFEFYCSVGNHRAQGMVGSLVVE